MEPREHIPDVPPRVVRVELDRAGHAPGPAPLQRPDEPPEERVVARVGNLLGRVAVEDRARAERRERRGERGRVGVLGAVAGAARGGGFAEGAGLLLHPPAQPLVGRFLRTSPPGVCDVSAVGGHAEGERS